MSNIIKTYWGNASINKKFTLIVVFVVIINVLFGVILTSVYTMKKLYEHSVKYMDTTLTFFTQQVNENLDNLKNVSQEILYDDIIYQALSQESAEAPAILNTQLSIREQLRNYIAFNPYITSAGIVTNAGFLYAYDDDNALSNYYHKSYTLDSNEDSNWIWDFDNNNIYLMRPFRNVNTFESMGMLILVFNNRIIQDLCDLAKLDKEYTLTIFSADKDLVYLTNKDYDVSLFDGKFLEHVSNSSGLMHRKSTKEFIYYSTLQSNGWKVSILASVNLLQKDVYMVLLLFVLFGIISCMAIFALIKIFSRHLLVPIQDIISSMSEFKYSNKLSTITVKRRDELGTLSHMYNEMIAHMNFLTETIYTKKLIAKNSQIRALQSQINPHFIFNTLDSINWIARLNKDNDAADMITALSNILRMTSGKTKSKIPLKDEISYVEDYISLVSTRFNDTLKILRHFEPETLDLEVPSLIIQPLLENALKHGIEKNDKNGVIWLKTSLSENTLYIEVVDNGSGIDTVNLDMLNQKLAQTEDSIWSDDTAVKIGLINTNRRIKLFYGSEYGITIDSKENFYTKVTCRLPILRHE